jgi:predicted porin
MKKLLLGTTALVGVALMAQPAAAQLEVTVGGNASFLFGVWDSDDPAPLSAVFDPADESTDRDFETDAEVVVRADGIADNGLQYGVKIELETSDTSSANVDEANIYVSGGWGRAEFGDDDGAADTMAIYAPTVGLEQLDGDWTDFAGYDDGVTLPFKTQDTGDDTKVTYYTPRFFGVQIGASYIPEDSVFEDVVAVKDGLNEQQGAYDNAFEFGLNYVGEFSGFDVIASGTYSRQEAVAINTDNLNAYQLGLQVGFGGFTVGGGWADNGNAFSTDDVDNQAWNIGASYEAGPWGFGAQYIDVDELNFQEGRDLWAVGAGATYEVAPGLSVGADFIWFDDDGRLDTAGTLTTAGTRNENNGWVLVTGLSASF